MRIIGNRLGRIKDIRNCILIICIIWSVQNSDAQTQIGANINGEEAFEQFGSSVSLNATGDIVAIGAAQHDGNGIDIGTVRVYQNTGNAWVQIGADLNGENNFDRFGRSLSLNATGDIVAIGGRGSIDMSPADAGYVRIYQNIDGVWTQIGSTITGIRSQDFFGSSVSLNAIGDIVAIGGTHYDGSSGINTGHVRVFQNVGGNWTQIGLDIEGEAPINNSGGSVSLNAAGDVVAIGADLNDGNGEDSGHVRVYRNITGVWTQIGQDIDGEAQDDLSGFSVSLNATGDIVAIGAPENDGNNKTDSGHVRIYQYVAGVWAQIGSDIDGEFAGDKSGTSVSLNATGDIVAIGEPESAVNGSFSGQVRVYQNKSGVWTLIADMNGANPSRFGTSVSLNSTGNSVAIGAPHHQTVSPVRAGIAQMFTYRNLINSTPVANSNQVSKEANIVMTFDFPATLSLNNTIVNGSQTGVLAGTFNNNGTTAVTFVPTSNFKPGELITIQLVTTAGLIIPYNFNFHVQPNANQITGSTPIKKQVVSTLPELVDVASGDLDGDGDIDLVGVSSSSNDVIWFQNDGAMQPTFTAQPVLYDGTVPNTLVNVILADANNDSDLDIFFSAAGTSKVFLIENQGSGVFGNATEIYSLGGPLAMLSLDDLDGDGLIDVIASRFFGDIHWLRNTGNHNFGSETIINNSDAVKTMAVGDIDHDGDIDVIGAANVGNEIRLYTNDGSGMFNTSILIDSNLSGVSSISIGDLDNDGDQDITLSDSLDHIIVWYENDGTGVSFIKRTVYSGTPSNGVENAAVKDLDGDGDLDILWAAQGTIAWSRNDGGSPISWTYLAVDAMATKGYNVDAADLNGDGTLEFIGTALGDSGGVGAALSWYSFNPPSFVSATPSVNSNTGAKDADIVMNFSKPVTLSSSNTIIIGSQTGWINGTFNNNGTSTVTFDPTADFAPGELITVQLTTATGLINPYSFSFRVQPMDNEIEVATPVVKSVVNTLPNLIDVASGDLDGDGHIDLITVSHSTSELLWFKSDGTSSPTYTAQSALYDGADTEELISVVLGDANNDGDLDIFFGGEIAGKLWLIENQGGGTFGTAIEINSGTALGLTSVFLGDLNGDGLTDVLATSATDNTLSWYPNNGNHTFGPETTITTSLAGASNVKVGDLDGDGDLDVIGASATDDEILWYPNNGDGTFGTSQTVGTVTDGVHGIAVGDLDGDGDVDVASANLDEDRIVWYENSANGSSFTKRTVYHDAVGTSSDRAIDVVLNDMDGDGDLDILWAADVEVGVGGPKGNIAVSRNDGGSPINWTYIPVDAAARRGYSVEATDLNNDGTLEVIGTALGHLGTDAALSWYKFETTSLNIRLYLSGSYNTGAGMMDDQLRVSGIIPTISPYGDGATCNASVFSVTGNNAIVDWVLVELRDKNDINTVITMRGALLQRDGDVVDVDGVSLLKFTENDSYYVSVSHRNHVTISSDQVNDFNGTGLMLDFTQLTTVRGGANAVVDLTGSGPYGLFPGDVDGSNNIQINDYANLLGVFGQSGYLVTDTNLNGQIQSTDLSLVLSFFGKGIQF